jgi:hypothetical protein
MLLSRPVREAALHFKDGEVHKPSLMASFALCPGSHVEGSLALVTGPAEMTFGDHVHLVRYIFHLEDTEVTSRALVAVRRDVFLIVEDDQSWACLMTS